MSNTDYILKAAIKKITEKLNGLLVEKIEEATAVAQDAPEIIKKEFDDLKESILDEAAKMEHEINTKNNVSYNDIAQNNILKALNEIEEIKKNLTKLNQKINSKI